MKNATPAERIRLIRRLRPLDTVRIDTMKAAAKRCGPAYPNTFLWSPTLKKNGSKMRYWNLRRTAGLAGDIEGESVHKPVGIEVEEAMKHNVKTGFGISPEHIQGTKKDRL